MCHSSHSIVIPTNPRFSSILSHRIPSFRLPNCMWCSQIRSIHISGRHFKYCKVGVGCGGVRWGGVGWGLFVFVFGVCDRSSDSALTLCQILCGRFLADAVYGVDVGHSALNNTETHFFGFSRSTARVQASQYLATSVCTTRTKGVARVKDPMSTFRQEKALRPVGRTHTVNA